MRDKTRLNINDKNLCRADELCVGDRILQSDFDGLYIETVLEVDHYGEDVEIRTNRSNFGTSGGNVFVLMNEVRF